MVRRVNRLKSEGQVFRLTETSGRVVASDGFYLIPPFEPYAHLSLDSSGDLGTFDVYGSPTYAAGKLGNAIFFNGSTDFLQTPHSWNRFIDSRPWSFAFWVYPGASNPGGKGIFGFGEDGGNTGFCLYYDSTNQWFSGGWFGDTWNSGASSYPHSNWYHVVITYEGGNLSYYVNNSLIRTVSHSFSFANAPMHLARDPFGAGALFNGGLDDFRVYAPGVLGVARIAEIWNGGSGTTAELSDDGGPGSEAVLDPNVPFTSARKFVRASMNFVETNNPLGGTYDLPTRALHFWFKLTTLPAASAEYMFVSDSEDEYVSVFELAGVITLRFRHSATNYDYDVTSILNTSDWFHFAAYSEGGVFVYLNGTEIVSVPGSSTSLGFSTMGASAPISGGARPSVYLDGLLGDMEAAQFRSLNTVHNILSAQSDPSYGLQVDAGTLACYNFNGAAAGTDETGSHDLVLGATPDDYRWDLDYGTISKGQIRRGDSLFSTVPTFKIGAHADFNDWGAQPWTIEMVVQCNDSAWTTYLQKYDGTSLVFSLYSGIIEAPLMYMEAKVQDSLGNYVAVRHSGEDEGYGHTTVWRLMERYIGLTWNPFTRTLGFSNSGYYKEASNPDIDITALANTADIEGPYTDIFYPPSGLEEGFKSVMSWRTLRLSKGVRTPVAMQSFLYGNDFRLLP